jgi:hypothetical protein
MSEAEIIPKLIAYLQERGYRVTKPKAKGAKPWPPPVFVCLFEDRELVRMSCYRSDAKALELAREAHMMRELGRWSRTNSDGRPFVPSCPAVLEWHWEGK